MRIPMEEGFLCNLCGDELFSWNKRIHIHRTKIKKESAGICKECGLTYGTGELCDTCSDNKE